MYQYKEGNPNNILDPSKLPDVEEESASELPISTF